MEIKIQSTSVKVIPVIKNNGDWIDLYVAEDITLNNSIKVNTETSAIEITPVKINLGVAMELPKGYEAWMVPRSSLFNKKGLLLANSIGIIDNSYCGEKDIWKFNAIATRDVQLKKGEAIAQFRIQLSQKAGVIAKIKWLFSNTLKLTSGSLGKISRGGFGSTGGYKGE